MKREEIGKLADIVIQNTRISAALEKQKPRKLNRIVNELGIIAFCQCGEEVRPPEVYCWACGQKLDWSEE